MMTKPAKKRKTGARCATVRNAKRSGSGISLLPGERLWRIKDLALAMDVHPRTVKRWWRRLGVPPDVRGHASHRWTPASAQKLLTRWQAYWLASGRDAAMQAKRYCGAEIKDLRQLSFSWAK